MPTSQFPVYQEPLWQESFYLVPPYKVTVSDRFTKEEQPFLYAKLSRNRAVDPPSVPTRQAPSHRSFSFVIECKEKEQV